MEEKDFQICNRPPLEKGKKPDPAHGDYTLYAIIKTPFPDKATDMPMMLTPTGAEKFIKRSKLILGTLLQILPSVIHAGHITLAEKIIEKLIIEHEALSTPKQFSCIIISLCLMNNFTDNYFLPDIKKQLLNIIKTPNLLKVIFHDHKILDTLLRNACHEHNETIIELFKYVIIQAAIQNQIVEFMSIQLEKNIPLVADLLIAACSTRSDIFISFLKHVITQAAIHKQIIELLTISIKNMSLLDDLLTNITSTGNEAAIAIFKEVLNQTITHNKISELLAIGVNDRKIPLLVRLLANACSNGNKASISLLKYLITKMVQYKKIIELMTWKDREERLLLNNLLSNACATGNEPAILLLKHTITEVATYGQITALMALDSNGKGMTLLCHLLAHINSTHNNTAILLMKHVITETALHAQIIELLTMSFSEARRSLLCDLLINACFVKNPSIISLQLLKHVITQTALYGKITALFAMCSNKEGKSLLRNLLESTCFHINPKASTLELFKYAITEAAFHWQIIELLAMQEDKKNYSLLRCLLVGGCFAAHHKANALEVLKHAIMVSAQNHQLIQLVCMFANDHGETLINTLYFASHRNKYAMELLQEITKAAAITGCLLELIKTPWKKDSSNTISFWVLLRNAEHDLFQEDHCALKILSSIKKQLSREEIVALGLSRCDIAAKVHKEKSDGIIKYGKQIPTSYTGDVKMRKEFFSLCEEKKQTSGFKCLISSGT